MVFEPVDLFRVVTGLPLRVREVVERLPGEASGLASEPRGKLWWESLVLSETGV